jgi:hypothetical protein
MNNTPYRNASIGTSVTNQTTKTAKKFPTNLVVIDSSAPDDTRAAGVAFLQLGGARGTSLVPYVIKGLNCAWTLLCHVSIAMIQEQADCSQ